MLYCIENLSKEETVAVDLQVLEALSARADLMLRSLLTDCVEVLLL